MASITASSVGKFWAAAGIALSNTAARPRTVLVLVLIMVSTRVAV
jgi:hypothetical protein